MTLRIVRAQGFSRVSASASRFPSLGNICLPSFDIPYCWCSTYDSTISNSTYFQLVLDRLFSVYSILSRKSPVYKSLIQQFLLGRTERWKKKEKVRKMQDRDGSRKRRLIWSEECREIREIFKQFHGPVNLTRCFPSSFFFFWMDQVEKYRNRGRTSQPWIRETFWRVNVLRSPMIVDGKVFVSTSDSWNSVMPTPGVNNPSLIVTPPPPDNSH